MCISSMDLAGGLIQKAFHDHACACKRSAYVFMGEARCRVPQQDLLTLLRAFVILSWSSLCKKFCMCALDTRLTHLFVAVRLDCNTASRKLPSKERLVDCSEKSLDSHEGHEDCCWEGDKTIV
jgi:hypothetical protein